jgi:AraC family transcriptional regulator
LRQNTLQPGDICPRVSVMVGDRSVPLPISHGASASTPWTGLILERHRVGAVEIPEHEHHTFCLHLQTSGPVEMDWHSHGRSGHLNTDAGNLIFLTPGTRDSLLWYGPSQRIIASIDPSILAMAATQLELNQVPDFENRWSFQDDQLRLLLTEMERARSLQALPRVHCTAIFSGSHCLWLSSANTAVPRLLLGTAKGASLDRH